MISKGQLNLTTPSEREISWTRVFEAPRNLVFDAITKPELIRQWLLGPDGWTMPVCEVDLRIGGSFRYVWHHPEKGDMGMGGVFREIIRPEKIVNTEVFDESWYVGEGVSKVHLEEQNGKTTLTNTMCYESKEARDMVMKSNMESGLTASYERLAGLLLEIG